MDSLIVPDLALLRRWLDQLGISFLSVTPVRRSICRTCKILRVCLMPKLIWLITLSCFRHWPKLGQPR